MRILSLLLALPACAALLAGCAGAPLADSGFGDAVRIAIARQVAYPAATGNANPVAGMDGRAAQHAQERYQKSFAQPAPAQTSLVINTGGAK